MCADDCVLIGKFLCHLRYVGLSVFVFVFVFVSILK